MIRVRTRRQGNYRRFHVRVGWLYAWSCWRGVFIGIDWR